LEGGFFYLVLYLNFDLSNVVMENDAYIVSGYRTPIGSLRGALSTVRADDLAAIPIRALMGLHKDLSADFIDEVILGCANQAGEDNRNVARMALLLAGLPYTVPGETINRLCASGMSAVIHAQRAILSNDADLVIAGGVEHMTRAPWVMSKASTAFGNDASLFDTSFGWRFVNPQMKSLYGTEAMGETAENLAQLYRISRDDQDMFAFSSQQKALVARSSGRFAFEIVPVTIEQKKQPSLIFDQDEFLRPDTNMDALGSLKPAFRKDGSVTAGNSSGLNDGAAALLVSSYAGLKGNNFTPMVRIVSSAVVGVEPRVMGVGPVEASQKALVKAGLTMNDMDLIEINEAFAVQVLACLRLLHVDDHDSRVNPNGGAIALGHPLGMSGARILLSSAIELQIQKKRYALVTMCIGVGQGYAVVLENCA
jgi:acetyl-CoA acyltransferase